MKWLWVVIVIVLLFIIAWLTPPYSFGSDSDGLPMGLRYGISKTQVSKQLLKLKNHRYADFGTELDYVFDDPDSAEFTLLSVGFDTNDKLISVEARRCAMGLERYEEYVAGIRSDMERWKYGGATVAIEDDEYGNYLLKNTNSCIWIFLPPPRPSQMEWPGTLMVWIIFEQRAHCDEGDK